MEASADLIFSFSAFLDLWETVAEGWEGRVERICFVMAALCDVLILPHSCSTLFYVDMNFKE